MRKISALLLFLILFAGCGGHSYEEFRRQGEGVTRSLICEMEKIHTHEDLLAARMELTYLFKELAELMREAKKYQELYAKEEPLELSEHNHMLSDQLRQEMNRLYCLDGGRELIESYQRDGLK